MKIRMFLGVMLMLSASNLVAMQLPGSSRGGQRLSVVDLVSCCSSGDPHSLLVRKCLGLSIIPFRSDVYNLYVLSTLIWQLFSDVQHHEVPAVLRLRRSVSVLDHNKAITYESRNLVRFLLTHDDTRFNERSYLLSCSRLIKSIRDAIQELFHGGFTNADLTEKHASCERLCVGIIPLSVCNKICAQGTLFTWEAQLLQDPLFARQVEQNLGSAFGQSEVDVRLTTMNNAIDSLVAKNFSVYMQPLNAAEMLHSFLSPELFERLAPLFNPVQTVCYSSCDFIRIMLAVGIQYLHQLQGESVTNEDRAALPMLAREELAALEAEFVEICQRINAIG